jgi:2-isopropylmalate synthase
MPKEVYDIFIRDFVNVSSVINITRASYADAHDGLIDGVITIDYNGTVHKVASEGNGRLDCASGALCQTLGMDYSLESYTQHALEGTTSSKAASYVSISKDGKTYWGCGIDADIGTSSVKALVSAVNVMLNGAK